MASPISIRLYGDKALQRKLDALGKKAARKIVRKAVRAGVKPLVQQARSNVPSDIDLEGLLAGRPNMGAIVVGKLSVTTSKRAKRTGVRTVKTRQANDISTALRRGIGSRVVSIRGAPNLIYGVVGPKARVKIGVARKESSGRLKFLANTTIAVLVEYGTSQVRAQPFIRPAFDQARHSALAALRRKTAEGIKAEWRKKR